MDFKLPSFGNFMDLGSFAYNVFSNERSRNDTIKFQKKAWEREDTAVQRRQADLKAAGLNPLLAVGQPASSMAPIRIGGTDTPKGNVFQSSESELRQKLDKQQISNAQAQNALLLAQAAKTVAEKDEVSARTQYYMRLSGATSANEKYLTELSGLTSQRIQNATLEYLTEQARYRDISASAVLKNIQAQIQNRDLKLLQRLGLLSHQPGGLTGQGGQVANQIFTILDRLFGSSDNGSYQGASDDSYGNLP